MDKINDIKINTRLMKSTGDELGLLGFGCMRFPRKGARIDMEAVERMITHAIDCGVNYFDTAYMYPGSEAALGTVLAKTGADGRALREKVKIATKLAQIMIKNREGMDKMLAVSLKRLQTDYIDYYLIHSLSSYNDWERMKKLGIQDFIREQLASGKIKHIGFSWHGNLADFRRVVDDYKWEFCMVQHNYLDEHFQAGTNGLAYAAQRGLGIVIMEPLRGGTLAQKLPPEAAKIIHGYKDENGSVRSAAYWALRWVMDKTETALVLSGMNTMEQLNENIVTTAEAKQESLTKRDRDMIAGIVEIYKKNIKVPCTGCNYCIPCPHNVNIPACFDSYNGKAVFGGIADSFRYLFSTGGKNPSRASRCVKCGVCEEKCPQHIQIMNSLSEAAKEMEKPWLTIPIAIVLKIMGK